MTASPVSLLQLYRRILHPQWVRATAKRLGLRVRGGVYSETVVWWLMIMQRVQEGGTLASAVGGAIGGTCGSLLSQRQRRNLSARTGGYCRARQEIPLAMMTAAVDQLTQRLQEKLSLAGEQKCPVYLLDGSSLQLPHEKKLLERYPPSKSSQGSSHWPVLRIVVAQEARSGLAVAPAWGPMYGPQAVSEQSLADGLLDRLPPDALVVGDRNFGVFSVAYSVWRSGRKVLFRMTKQRAESIAGAPLIAGSEQSLVWRPTRWELQHHPELPPEACVSGRLLVYPLPGFRELLYLFTTWEQASREEALESYGCRWNVESDLRALKQTVGLHRVQVKSEAMLEKELLAAVAAYNLVRTIISLAVQPLQWHPRELSFTHVLNLVQAFLPVLLEQPSPRRSRELRLLIRATQQCRLPKRPRRRSYPRAVWGRGYRFPVRHENGAEW
jgi:hypothetical protein